jgi:DNA-nicking Smr family endonuclease
MPAPISGSDSDPNADPESADEDASALFRAAVGPVKRIFHDRIEPLITLPPPTPRQSQRDEQQVLEEMLYGSFDHSELETGEELYYHREGIQRSVLRKLRRGHYRVYDALDLHGMNVATARLALNDFLQQARRQHLSCVRIIHGKGKRSRNKGPVLKTKVNHWLRHRDDILAFCSARPMDGGTGALYVLLRSQT